MIRREYVRGAARCTARAGGETLERYVRKVIAGQLRVAGVDGAAGVRRRRRMRVTGDDDIAAELKKVAELIGWAERGVGAEGRGGVGGDAGGVGLQVAERAGR